MKKAIIFLRIFSICFVLGITVYSCRKDLSLSDQTIPVMASAIAPSSNTFEVDNKTHVNDPMTVLGEKRENPFTVERMNQAHSALYNQKGNLVATHLYVKFLPQSGEELKKLDQLEVNFYDYPLEYEVKTMGEYYHDPSVAPDKPTPLYAVVKPDFVLPKEVQTEVITPLHLSNDEKLIETAFHLTGNDPDKEGFGIQGEASLAPNPIGTGGGGTGGGNGGGGGGAGDPTNCVIRTGACGCAPPPNQRNPAGCITVVDDANLPTNTNFGGQAVHVDGVRRVKVITKDSWFTEDETFTNDNGCFQINSKYRGKAWVWVKFKSSRTTIRSFRGARIWEYALAVKDYVGKISGPNFNNINVTYSHVQDDSDRGKLYWYAATVNNALHEFDEFAACDGINTTPQGLDILLTNFKGGAAAPMLNELIRMDGITIGTAVIGGGVLLGLTSVVISGALLIYITAFAPDVVFNYGGETTTMSAFRPRLNQFSDKVKETAYHEYAHAAHFNGINAAQRVPYWSGNISYIIRHLGYGDEDDQTDSGADRCAVIEGWGYHLGMVYADRRYGANHTNTNSAVATTRENRRHIFLLEEENPLSPTFAEVQPGWIPQGIILDLIDNNNSNPTTVTDGIQRDNIRGFSTRQYFQLMVQGTAASSPLQIRDRLIQNNLPVGVPNTAVVDMFNQYRWR